MNDTDRAGPVIAPDPAPKQSRIAFEPNDLAFPSANYAYVAAGLTKREYFAALAMQGILSNSSENCFYSADGKPAVTMADNYRYGAQIAVSYADAVILALNAEPQS